MFASGIGDGDDTGPSPDDRPDPAQAAARSWRILIVEDQWLIAVEIEAALTDAGYEVVGHAMNAEEAVRLCETERPDLVLMDVRLEGGSDGVEAAVEVRTRFGVPSVFITAHGDPETRDRAKAAEPLDWIVKPIVSSELIRRLDRVRLAAKH